MSDDEDARGIAEAVLDDDFDEIGVRHAIDLHLRGYYEDDRAMILRRALEIVAASVRGSNG